jgi:hypothetical protein
MERLGVHYQPMGFTAKDATILTLVSAQPLTRHFEQLLERVDDPEVKRLALDIRERAAQAAAAATEAGAH